MLQRAASNAYSWWWASHIRTKQSKWLEQSIQDMEEKVQGMIKLIEEDGDSFAKRAEMYYKRRPELIGTVEEAFKSFRALADRYDLLSKELQNANNTIASVCPEQVPYIDDDDDEAPRPKFPKSVPPTANAANIPKAPTKDLKGLLSTASKQVKAKKPEKPQVHHKLVQKSGLTKDEALKEIDKLQKDILVMQTAKEYFKSSYESGAAKYWEIENQITEMQQKVCLLRDEFNVDSVIEDHEARTLMAEAALKSCQEALAQLQEKQEISIKEAREEYKKIEDACQRLKSLKSKFLPKQVDEEKTTQNDKTANGHGSERSEVEKSEVKFDSVSSGPLTVTELAEKIDELVTTVIGLEGALSSQTILINTLTTESDELHSQIRNLENEKETLIGDTQSLSTRIKEMEEKLAKIQELNKNVESQHSSLQAEFAGARSSLNHLTEKLGSIKPDEESEDTSSNDTAFSSLEGKLHDNDIESSKHVPPSAGDDSSSLKTEENVVVKEVFVNVVKEAVMNAEGSELSVPERKEEPEKTTKKSVTFLEQKLEEKVHVDHLKDPIPPVVQGDEAKGEELNWQQMLLTGEDDREKILLKEYTEILRNFKDVKNKLRDMEKKDRDNQFDIMLQLSEQKKALLKKDEVIQRLREKLNSKRDNKGDDVVVDDDVEVNETFDTPTADKFDEMNSIFLNNNTTASVSIVEEKLRMEIDAILDENLDFWLRFSTSFHQIQKYRTEVQDLQQEITKLKEKKKQEGSGNCGIKSELRPIYKHLHEIQTELNVWLQRSVSLKEELKGRFASLCSIQEEITKALKEGVEEDEILFSSHQAAKFQGEILNMKQENNKVREELNAVLDHVSVLQVDIEKTLRRLNEEFDICGDQSDSKNHAKVPLRSFIFGTKPKNKKNSIFSITKPNKKFQVLKSGVPMPNNNVK